MLLYHKLSTFSFSPFITFIHDITEILKYWDNLSSPFIQIRHFFFYKRSPLNLLPWNHWTKFDCDGPWVVSQKDFYWIFSKTAEPNLTKFVSDSSALTSRCWPSLKKILSADLYWSWIFWEKYYIKIFCSANWAEMIFRWTTFKIMCNTIFHPRWLALPIVEISLNSRKKDWTK